MFDELRGFLLIVEHGTFTAAAKKAHLSQPALSAAIQRLEHQMGARLLERGAGGASPTAAGDALIPWAKSALVAVQRGKDAVAEVQGLKRGQVCLAAGATACTYLLPPILQAFHQAHPGIRLLLREAGAGRIQALVASGEADLGIVTGEEGALFRSDPLILVGVPGKTGPDQPFVSFPHGASPIRAVLEARFPDAAVAIELNSAVAIKGCVRAGMGVALLGQSAVERDIEAGILVRIEHPMTPIARTLRIVEPSRKRTPAAEAMLQALLVGSPTSC